MSAGRPEHCHVLWWIPDDPRRQVDAEEGEIGVESKMGRDGVSDGRSDLGGG